MNKKKLTKNEIILGYIAIAFMQIAVFFGVLMLIGMIQIYAENFILVHSSFHVECLCRVAIASFGFILAVAWFELDGIAVKFFRKARKELKRNEDK